MRAALALIATFALSCSGTSREADASIDAGLDASAVPFDGGTCTASIAHVVVTSRNHVPQGTPVVYNSNPPVGGDHYPEWLHWDRSYGVVDRGNYVHNEEHGGVILINPCETGCDEVSAELLRIGQSLAQDPLCTPPINARWLVTRDPLVPAGTGVAAAAWEWRFVAPCPDTEKLTAFIQAHIGQGPEDLCVDGSLP
jgi:hypothetical protein